MFTPRKPPEKSTENKDGAEKNIKNKINEMKAELEREKERLRLMSEFGQSDEEEEE